MDSRNKRSITNSDEKSWEEIFDKNDPLIATLKRYNINPDILVRKSKKGKHITEEQHIELRILQNEKSNQGDKKAKDYALIENSDTDRTDIDRINSLEAQVETVSIAINSLAKNMGIIFQNPHLSGSTREILYKLLHLKGEESEEDVENVSEYDNSSTDNEMLDPNMSPETKLQIEDTDLNLTSSPPHDLNWELTEPKENIGHVDEYEISHDDDINGMTPPKLAI